jgi:hypothetical protein
MIMPFGIETADSLSTLRHCFSNKFSNGLTFVTIPVLRHVFFDFSFHFLRADQALYGRRTHIFAAYPEKSLKITKGMFISGNRIMFEKTAVPFFYDPAQRAKSTCLAIAL